MELGRLSAVFEADTRDFDAKLKASEARIDSLKSSIASIRTDNIGAKGARTNALQDLLRTATREHKSLQLAQKETARTAQQAAKAIGTDLTGALGTLSPRLAGIATAAGPLTAVAASLVAVGAAAAGIYKLATFSAQLGGEIHDLSQKVNFSAETLSSLKVAAELSGGSLASLSTSLGIFDRNIEEAADKSTEMSRIFKVLKIDTDDNEKALRQAFVQLGNITSGSLQTATAMKLFGRSGKEVLGIIKESGGDVDAYIEKLREMGLVITKDGAEKADKFGDQLTLLKGKLEAIARQIGTELVPTVSKAADDISRWLQQNQGEIIKTAKELGNLVSWVYSLGKAIAANSPYVIAINVVRTFTDVVGGISAGSAAGAAAATARQGGSINAAGQRLPTGLPTLSPFRTPGYGTFGTPFRLTPEQQAAAATRRAQEALEQRLRDATAKQPGGGSGGGGSAKKDPAVQLLKELEEQFRNLTPRTELQKVQQKLLNEEYAKSRDEIKKKIMITAMEIDQQTKILDLTRERFTTEESFARLREEEYNKTLTRATRVFAIERERFGTRAGRDRPSWIDLGGGSTVGGEPGDTTRPRIATVELQVMRERAQMIREQMQDLAGELTSVFSRAVGDGFERGAKRGLQSLALGLLDIVQNVFLAKLAEGLANILTNVASGSGGGGGFWGGLLKSLLGAAVGGAVGGAVGNMVDLGGGSTYTPGGTGTTRPRLVGPRIDNRAMGGPVLAGLPYRVHKDELIVPTQNGMVFNKGQQGTVINNYIQLPQTPKGTYSSPSSQRELANKLVAALQGAQT